MARRKRGRVLVREVLAELRGGAAIRIGGSRCHLTYLFDDGGWWLENFDEGYVERQPTDEAAIRKLIAGERDHARAIIHAARWRAFSEAFLEGGDPRRALQLLEASRKFGERFHYADVLEAFLRCPPTLEPKVAALIRREFESFTLYHAFMEAAGWDRSPETARKGVLFVDRMLDLVGTCPGCFKVRASFHDEAGDLTAALADLERELEQAPEDSWTHEQLTVYADALRANAPGA